MTSEPTNYLLLASSNRNLRFHSNPQFLLNIMMMIMIIIIITIIIIIIIM